MDYKRSEHGPGDFIKSSRILGTDGNEMIYVQIKGGGYGGKPN